MADLLTGILLEELSDADDMQMADAILSMSGERSRMTISTGAALMPDDSGDPVRVERYAEEVVPMYSDGTFKSHFRMHRSTFEDLCKTVGPLMVKERYLTVEKRLLATVWLLSNQESYRGVADRFGLSKGTLHLTVMATCQVLLTLMSDLIQFPGTMQAMKEVAEGFMARCGLPGVVGAIDGTHIPIPAPTTEHRASFVNRKGFSNMVLQVVCDSNLKFLDVFTGWPGSVHDARVFRNSPVREQINNLPEEFHVLGDSAYPLSKHSTSVTPLLGLMLNDLLVC